MFSGETESAPALSDGHLNPYIASNGERVEGLSLPDIHKFNICLWTVFLL